MKKFENNFTDSYVNGDFLAYLKNNGDFHQLTKTIRNLEKESESFYLSRFLTKENERVVYEIPTNELCNVLATIFKDHELIEVGAGSALLSARLQKHFNINIIATDKFDNNFRIKHNNDFTEVFDISFEELDKKFDNITNKVIIISWLHSSNQTLFIDMIKRNNPAIVVHIGEHEGACYDENFISNLKMLNYHYVYILPIKQISKIDYFVDDKIRKENTSRTCTTIFSKNKIDLLEGDYQAKLGQDNFGEYQYCDDNYVIQDLENPRAFDFTDKTNPQNMMLTMLQTLLSNK